MSGLAELELGALNGVQVSRRRKRASAHSSFSKMVRTAQVLVAIAASAAAFTAPRSLPTRTAMKFSAAEAELVPRDVLFGNPEYAAPSVTPDGPNSPT